MFAYFHLLLAGPLVITLSGATAPPNPREPALPTVAEIRQAWSHRSKTMGPFALQAELTEQVAVKGKPLSNDPFETRRAGREVNLVTIQNTMEMVRDGTKLRTAIQGESVDIDNGEVYELQRHTSFDGKVYKSLARRGDASFGLGAFGTDGTIVWLSYKTTAFQAIDWWLDPVTLLKGVPDANIQISETDHTLPGREFITLKLFKNGRIKSAIIASKSPPYLPIETTHYTNSGRMSSKCTFEYSLDAVGRDRLMSWHHVYFEADESQGRRFKGKTVEFTYGKPPVEVEFNLQFPVGTHIIQYFGTSRRLLIQHSPTEMKHLKPTDYGKFPEASGEPAS